MVKYDPDIIQQHAERLYSKAAWVVFWSTVIGLLVGGGAGFAIGSGGHGKGSDATIPLVIGAAVGGIIGLAVGRERSFHLKLAAQIALCQVQIEIHTRDTHATVYAMAPQAGPPQGRG